MFRSLRIFAYLAVSFFMTCVAAHAGTRNLLEEIWAKLSKSSSVSAFKTSGGVQLLLQMNRKDLLADQLEALKDEAQREVSRTQVDGKRIRRTRPKVVGEAVQFKLHDSAYSKQVLEKLKSLRGGSVEVSASAEGVISIALSKSSVDELVQSALRKSVDSIGQRIYHLVGVTPIIRQVGGDKIIVLLPGVSDAGPLVSGGQNLPISRVTFHLVDNTQHKNEVPSDSMLVPDASTGEMLLLKKRSLITGYHIESAAEEIDSNTSRPVIAIKLDPVGTKVFGQITQDNIGKRLAVVLDNGTAENGKRDRKVLTAPVVQTAILTGALHITGKFSLKEVKQLVAQIRSRPLPASFKILEQRVVKPNPSTGPPAKSN